MKATVVGAAVPAKTLRAACARVSVPSKDVRTIGTRAWVELPLDTRDRMLAALAEALGIGLMVIEVEMPAGMRGDGLLASRATYRGVEEDVTQEAKGILHDWLNNSAGPGFDEELAATELAWALIQDDSKGAGTSPAESNVEDVWAQALFDKLIATGKLEMRSQHAPITKLAFVLQSPGRELGNRLLDALIDAPAVDEVFADAEELAQVARETKPKRA